MSIEILDFDELWVKKLYEAKIRWDLIADQFPDEVNGTLKQAEITLCATQLVLKELIAAHNRLVMEAQNANRNS